MSKVRDKNEIPYMNKDKFLVFLLLLLVFLPRNQTLP